jgi:hypothetical protein
MVKDNYNENSLCLTMFFYINVFLGTLKEGEKEHVNECVRQSLKVVEDNSSVEGKKLL